VAGKPQYDWQEIQDRFITGKETMRELIAIYGCAHSTLGVRASTEGWNKKRTEYRRKIKTVANAKAKRAAERELNGIPNPTIAEVLDRLNFDNRCERSCDVVVARAGITLTAWNNAIVKPKEERTEHEHDLAQMRWVDVQRVLQVVKEAQAVKYRALGVPAPLQEYRDTTILAPARVTRSEIEELLGEAVRAGDLSLPSIASSNGSMKRNGKSKAEA